MKKINGLFLFILSCSVFNIICLAGQTEKTIIKIGVIAPLSGQWAAFGEEVRNAILLANEDHPDSKLEFNLIFEDDQMTPSQTAIAAQKLIHFDKVDAFISIGSPAGNVVSPLAEKNGIIHFCMASDPQVAKGKYNFTHNTPPENEVQVFIEELKKRNVHRLATIEQNQQGWLSIGNQLEKKLAEAKIVVTSRNRYQTGEKDFRMTIAKVKQQKPDLIFITGFSPDLDILKKQIDESQACIPVTSIDGFDLTENPQFYEELWYVGATPTPAMIENRLKEKFKMKRVLYLSGLAYDIMNLLMQGYDHCVVDNQKPTNEKVAEDLLKFQNYKSILDPVSMSPEGIVETQARVKIIKEGRSTPLN